MKELIKRRKEFLVKKEMERQEQKEFRTLRNHEFFMKSIKNLMQNQERLDNELIESGFAIHQFFSENVIKENELDLEHDDIQKFVEYYYEKGATVRFDVCNNTVHKSSINFVFRLLTE